MTEPVAADSRARLRRAATLVLGWACCVLVGALLVLPWAVERAVEHAGFDDRVGTLPVDVTLSHNGYSSLDTGLFGKVYWRHTAALGFGATLRSTGPPLAEGTLSSYVSPTFVRANTAFLDDPDGTTTVYAAELRRQVVTGSVEAALIGGVVIGSTLAALVALTSGRSRRTRWLVVSGVVIAVGAASTGIAVSEFRSWDDDQAVALTYPLPGQADVSFSSPQTREIAQQVQPFILKMTDRIRENTEVYEVAAHDSVREQLPERAADLQPRDGEVVVIAEADPQGSQVGTQVRSDLYEALDSELPDGSVVLRTIAGDISSNGTVAESGFVKGEAAASPGVPVVAATGDHDTDVTVQQLLDGDVVVPDTEVDEVGGLRVASARDPAFKALFGGLVVNDSGLTEADIGLALREDVDDSGADDPVDVVLHQPRAVEGYLGVDMDTVKAAGTSLTTPVDDGIPDLPPGIVTYGHLHDAAGPWVLWNTDGDDVTWTVVTQLGTAGGVEENPTFNRFSTPFSVPLKTLSVQLQYVDAETGLQTGLLPITYAVDGTATVGDRIDLGLPPATSASE